MAICPFHIKSDGTPERNPSFSMNSYSGLWFCHACQSRGNLFSFLKNVGVNGTEIERAYRSLINDAVKNMPPAPDPLKPKLFSTDPIQEGLLGIFDNCPTALINAGFTEDTLRHFGVGFDMQHMRITYPIRDLAGNLVAISGRPVNDAGPHYKIYDTEYITWGLPQRINWDKRTVLWHANDIYPRVYFQTVPESVVVVEGFKACMAVWQAGISNVVALLGTYMSWEHKWILERLGAPVYLFLDNNEPGKTGTRRAIEALKKSMFVYIVNYPERLQEVEEAQPDSCTSVEIKEQVQNAVSYINWQ